MISEQDSETPISEHVYLGTRTVRGEEKSYQLRHRDSLVPMPLGGRDLYFESDIENPVRSLVYAIGSDILPYKAFSECATSLATVLQDIPNSYLKEQGYSVEYLRKRLIPVAQDLFFEGQLENLALVNGMVAKSVERVSREVDSGGNRAYPGRAENSLEGYFDVHVALADLQSEVVDSMHLYDKIMVGSQDYGPQEKFGRAPGIRSPLEVAMRLVECGVKHWDSFKERFENSRENRVENVNRESRGKAERIQEQMSKILTVATREFSK